MTINRSLFEKRTGFTISHSSAWIDTLMMIFPHLTDASDALPLPDGREVLFCALQSDRLGPWRWLDAMPFALFGAPVLSEGDLTPDILLHTLRHFSRGAGALSVNFDPVHPLAQASSLGSFASPLTTHILRLEGDFEAAQRLFTKTVRYDVRTAEKKGVTGRRGRGLPDFLAYYALVRLAVRRWGLTVSPFPQALYQAFARAPEQDISLWLAEWEGQVIGGQINIHYAPGRTLYWGSALHPDFTHLNPTKLLQHQAIREACGRGVTVYNMGPSAGFDGRLLAGVRQAKEAFGAAPHEYAVGLYQNPWAIRARAVRNRLRRGRSKPG